MKKAFKFISIFLSTLVLPLTIEAFEDQKSKVKNNWEEYFENTLNAVKPSLPLTLALQYLELENKTPGLAIDLGTGTGRDALFLLQNDWKVYAIDAEPLALEILLNRAQSEQHKSLEVEISTFHDMNLPSQSDLINASYALPFCTPEEFPKVWSNVVEHLAVGGRFTGQFFGDHDEWADNPEMTFHTKEQMLKLFEGKFIIEYLQIEEGLLPTAAGSFKHWHVYHVVARKLL